MWMTLRLGGLIAAMQHFNMGLREETIALNEARYGFPDRQHNDHEPRNGDRIGQSQCARNAALTADGGAFCVSTNDAQIKLRYLLAKPKGSVMMKHLFCLAALAGPAWADCPVAADLAAGITFQMGPDVSETYQMLSADQVALTSTYSDGYVSRALLGQGVYLLEFVEIDNGVPALDTRVDYVFSILPDEMPAPEPGGVFLGRMTVSDSAGTYEDKVVARWGALEQRTYGDCTYDMIAGTLASSGDGYPYEEGIHYLPELGIGYLATYLDVETDEMDVYEVTGIVPVGK
ncbi:hypothetical protein DS901_14845 [Loktanella sp. D2R18]|nr:hypothetical protein DS901_14845 [Loktanella sp. D2R18]